MGLRVQGELEVIGNGSMTAMEVNGVGRNSDICWKGWGMAHAVADPDIFLWGTTM